MLQELGARYLHEEFEQVIGAWGIETLDDYLRADRRGRRFPLAAEERALVWRVYTAFREGLHRDGHVTWHEARKRALDRADPAFDVVVADEVQDLTPVSLRFLAALAKDPAQIYLTADAGQSIYASGFT
ncbi:MAG: UvrD-helicase domain-containing protein [Trueperaceae bacterium]|nr:UvrD-helicase domain-containing protein [Trueperaceae bacterium]